MHLLGLTGAISGSAWSSAMKPEGPAPAKCPQNARCGVSTQEIPCAPVVLTGLPMLWAARGLSVDAVADDGPPKMGIFYPRGLNVLSPGIRDSAHTIKLRASRCRDDPG